MAIFDAMLEFSDAQSMIETDSTESIASTNILDFQANDLEMGAGEPMYLNVKVGNTAIIDGTTDSASTLTVKLVADSTTTLDVGSTVTFQTRAFAQSEMLAGAWLARISLPVTVDSERYVGMLYTVGGAAITAGTINAWIDSGPQSSYDTQVSASNI